MDQKSNAYVNEDRIKEAFLFNLQLDVGESHFEFVHFDIFLKVFIVLQFLLFLLIFI